MLKRVLDASHPLAGEAVAAAVVVQGDDLAFEDLEQAVGFHLVSALDVAVRLGRRDLPAVLAVEHLVPPAVEHRTVERPVEGGLLPAGPAGFQGPAGVVEPNVAALEHHAGHGDVVVLDERGPVAHRRLPGELEQSGGSSPCRGRRPGGPCRRRRAGPAAWSRAAELSAARAATGAGWPVCRRRTGGQNRWSARWGRAPRLPRRHRSGRRPFRAGTPSDGARTKPTSASFPCSRALHSSSSRASEMRAQSARPGLLPGRVDVLGEQVVHRRARPRCGRGPRW